LRNDDEIEGATFFRKAGDLWRAAPRRCRGAELAALRCLDPRRTEAVAAGCKVGRAVLGGSLACAENTNTLARFSLLSQGELVHVASYIALPVAPPDYVLMA